MEQEHQSQNLDQAEKEDVNTPASQDNTPWHKQLPPVTTTVIAACTLIYIIQCILDGSLFEISSDTLLKMGALMNIYVYAGEYWRLFTAFWLHHGIIHLVGNMAMLLIMGWMVELTMGAKFYIALLLVAGITGCCWSFNFYSDRIVYLMGFSDAVLAVIGAYVAFILVVGGLKSIKENPKNYFYLFFLVLISIVGESSQNPDIYGHIVGFLCGVIMAVPYTYLYLKKEQYKLASTVLTITSIALLSSAYYAVANAPQDIFSFAKITQNSQNNHELLVNQVNDLLDVDHSPENDAKADSLVKELNTLIGLHLLIDNLNIQDNLKQREKIQQQLLENDRDFFKQVYAMPLQERYSDTTLFARHNAMKDSLWNEYESFFTKAS